MWRNVVHGKDETLRLKSIYTERFPIPVPTDESRVEVETAVRRLIDITAETQSQRRDLLNWLKVEFDVIKPTQKLAELVSLDSSAFTSEVKKIRGKKASLSIAGVRQLAEAHAETVVPLQAMRRKALEMELRISDLVNQAYGLTPADVALMWKTAPPRMPIPAPGSERF